VSLQAVGEILARAAEDEEFRQSVLTDAREALTGYDLSPVEVQAFAAGELRALLIGPVQRAQSAERVQRMSIEGNQ
jgi:hypothetical protein